MDSSFTLLMEETQPVIEHTVKTVTEILYNHCIQTKSKVEIDDESVADICSHLALVYHMLVVSVSDAIIEKKDINKPTQNALLLIKQLSLLSDAPSTEVELATARSLVDILFSKAKGNA